MLQCWMRECWYEDEARDDVRKGDQTLERVPICIHGVRRTFPALIWSKYDSTDVVLYKVGNEGGRKIACESAILSS